MPLDINFEPWIYKIILNNFSAVQKSFKQFSYRIIFDLRSILKFLNEMKTKRKIEYFG